MKKQLKTEKTQKKAQKIAQKITFHIITLFPTTFESYLGESIVKRAIDDGKIVVKFYNPRDYTVPSKRVKDPQTGKMVGVWSYADRRVDDRAYGGGPGMVIEALPVVKAIDAAVGKLLVKKSSKTSKVNIVFFSPSGKQLNTVYAKKSATQYTDIVLVCGRYEGIDARVKKIFKMEDVSVGPYVLTGGELPAMLVIDTIARQVPGVLGDIASLEESRIAAVDVYTRPEAIIFKKKTYRVPKILLSGDHKKIEEWRAATHRNEKK